MSKYSKTLKAVVGIAFAFALVLSSSADAAITSFLKPGSRNSQVMEFKQFLNNCSAETKVASTGAGSPGYETSYFGPATTRAARAFQTKMGLVPDALIGAKTRAAINAGCGTNPNANTFAPAGCTNASGFSPVTGGACYAVNGTVPQTGAATVGLSTDTPATSSLADAGNANFTKFYVSAGATNLSINSIRVTRYGLSTNASLENIKILDGNGVPLTTAGTLNSNNQVNLTFTPSLTILAGATQQFYVRAGYVDATVGGLTTSFGIAQASDRNASQTVGGTFPINGNTVTSVLL